MQVKGTSARQCPVYRAASSPTDHLCHERCLSFQVGSSMVPPFAMDLPKKDWVQNSRTREPAPGYDKSFPLVVRHRGTMSSSGWMFEYGHFVLPLRSSEPGTPTRHPCTGAGLTCITSRFPGRRRGSERQACPLLWMRLIPETTNGSVRALGLRKRQEPTL